MAQSFGPLWWFLACTVVAVAILCTSMLAGRRLSTEQNLESCRWIGDDADASLSSPPQPLVDQVVVIIIDALTPRVALGPPHRGRKRRSSAPSDRDSDAAVDTAAMPHVRETVTSADYAPRDRAWFTHIRDELDEDWVHARGFFSVADAPTTTAQRTKAMMTGTIPVLLEAGASFNSFAVEEDNLLAKLGGRVAVLGDDTWVRLFPAQRHWARAHVFESFDVRDLHTVDNGILEHLNSVLLNTDDDHDDYESDMSSNSAAAAVDQQRETKSARPKLVIAHFLGVDHAGHQYNARDPHLYGKVAQLNRVLRNVSQLLRRRARPENTTATPAVSTLLLVMGDHGMTESGDHGGSTPAETDTFLFSQVFPALRKSRNAAADNSTLLEIVAHREPFDTCQWSDSLERPASDEILRDIGRRFTDIVRRKHCGTARLCRITEPARIDEYCARAGCEAAVGDRQQPTPLTAIHQIDLVPTLAAVLGVPIPRQNLGRIAPEIVLQGMMSLCQDQRMSAHIGMPPPVSSSWRCTTTDVYRALERLMRCNVRQLRAAFCAEFQQDSPLCRDPAPYVEKEGEFDDPEGDASSERFVDWTAIRRMMASIERLDLEAAQLTRAAREALTDVDIAAVLCALFLGLLVGFSVIWRFFFSYPATSFCGGGGGIVHPLKSSIKTIAFQFVVAAALLRFGGGCRSSLALFVALPSFLVTWHAGLDKLRWLAHAREILPINACSSSAAADARVNISASVCFLLFVVRIGVQMSNSFIVREDVAVCALVATLLFFGQHVQHHISVSAPAMLPLRVRRLRGFLPAIALSAIAALSLHLGRRTRDFDSHFVEARSQAQNLHRALLERFVLVSSPALSASSYLRFQNLDEYLAEHGQSRTVAAFVFLRWLLLDSCFIHAVLLATVVGTLVAGAFSSRCSSLAPRGIVRRWSWRALFAAGFLWNCAVSNVTSLQAFLLQSAFLFLWVRCFPCSSLRRRCGGGATAGAERSRPLLLLRTCSAVDGLMLHCASWLFFFASGSQCVFSTIDWNMAFVGVGASSPGGSVNLSAGGLLVAAHTFRPFIVSLVVSLYVSQKQQQQQQQLSANANCGGSDEDSEADKRGAAPPRPPPTTVGLLAPTLVYLNAALCVTMCYSMVRHRGHLMSWEVFFPRFAFEVIVLGISICAAAAMSVVLP